MMTRKSVGYFEGTDPAILTSLVCEGYDTIPISNGLDNYGQHVRLFNEENKVDLLVGYLHKIIAPVGVDTQADDVLRICEIYQIPFMIIVPEGLHNCACQKFEHCPDTVQFVDSSKVLEAVREILRS